MGTGTLFGARVFGAGIPVVALFDFSNTRTAGTLVVYCTGVLVVTLGLRVCVNTYACVVALFFGAVVSVVAHNGRAGTYPFCTCVVCRTHVTVVTRHTNVRHRGMNAVTGVVAKVVGTRIAVVAGLAFPLTFAGQTQIINRTGISIIARHICVFVNTFAVFVTLVDTAGVAVVTTLDNSLADAAFTNVVYRASGAIFTGAVGF